MKYDTLATKDTTEKTISTLAERNVEAFVVENGAEAMVKIKELEKSIL